MEKQEGNEEHIYQHGKVVQPCKDFNTVISEIVNNNNVVNDSQRMCDKRLRETQMV